MESLLLLHQLAEGGRLTSDQLFSDIVSEEDIDALLDERDKKPFREILLRMEDQIQVQLALRPMPKDFAMVVDHIRELTYLDTYRQTKHPELSGNVSDDFGLIAKALWLQHPDPWLLGFAHSYLEGRIPVGEVAAYSTPICEQLLQIA